MTIKCEIDTTNASHDIDYVQISLVRHIYIKSQRGIYEIPEGSCKWDLWRGYKYLRKGQIKRNSITILPPTNISYSSSSGPMASVSYFLRAEIFTGDIVHDQNII